jgi:RHS repeat-associated protein
MFQQGRNYTAAIRYRYGFNGKENENENNEIARLQDYGMRIYDLRIARFLSVDPLATSYPFYTPYQFAGNSPIKFIDLDGLEPAEPGKKQGQSAVASKKGTDDYFNWTWVLNKKTKKSSWNQGSSTMYQNGDILHSSSHNDDNKNYYPDVKVRSISTPSIGMVPSTNIDNDLTARFNGFVNAFTTGTKFENNGSEAESDLLLNNFIKGASTALSYKPTSNMSRLLGEDPAFLKLAKSFEQQALAYYNSKGTLEGFNGHQILLSLGKPYIKNTLFMHTVLGGTQQWNALITKISANEIKVRYTVWDHFGAGTDDAKSLLPGLPSLYWLQHNSSHFYPSTVHNYAPFNWNIRVNR